MPSGDRRPWDQSASVIGRCRRRTACHSRALFITRPPNTVVQLQKAMSESSPESNVMPRPGRKQGPAEALPHDGSKDRGCPSREKAGRRSNQAHCLQSRPTASPRTVAIRPDCRSRVRLSAAAVTLPKDSASQHRRSGRVRLMLVVESEPTPRRFEPSTVTKRPRRPPSLIVH